MSFFKILSFRQKVFRIVLLGVMVFLFIIFFQNLDLLIEHIKNNPILGIPYFLIQMIRHIITHYALALIGLVVFLFFLTTKFTKPRLLAILYFVLPFPFFSIVLGEEEFLPFNFIVSGIFFLFGIGIWKNKTWAHIAALALNAIFLGGAAFLFNRIVNTSCEGLGCIGIGIVWLLSFYIIGFTLLTSSFLWYNIRAKGDTKVNKKIIWEAVVVEIIILMIVGVVFAPSYLAQSGKVAEHKSILQPNWDRKRLEQKQAIQEAIDSGKILYPSYLPLGWKKESESLDKIQYAKYGIDRQVFQVKQSSRASFESKSKENLWTDRVRAEERTNTFVNVRVSDENSH